MMHSNAAERNKDPILEVLKHYLLKKGSALEVASGSGQHVIHFAHHFPDWTFQPTDLDPKSLESISYHIDESGLKNISKPILMDICKASLKQQFDAILNINMIHISPKSSTESLAKYASQSLHQNGILYIYGPFLYKNTENAHGNLDFDQILKSKNPEWGIRFLDDVVQTMKQNHLILEHKVEMPANNLSLIFRKHDQ